MDAALLVGIPADFRYLAGTPFHIVNEKYVLAVTGALGAVPVLIPALAEALPIDALLTRIDGLLIPGSPSNVDPARYGNGASPAGTLKDARRDASTLPLIRAALTAGVPLLAICRGVQELNVALGGTLHERVHEEEGRHDHRAPLDASIDVRYAPSHRVQLAPGGMLATALGTEQAAVNSVHWQAIDRLAPNLDVEATAEDGTIEAVRVADAPNFAVGVQWHPEYRFADDAVSRALFGAFAAAMRARAEKLRRAA
ncbi:gamma-glutamyl-gamma-aminobutyrate hydrolase [Rhodospirillales bacterium TMPK1]|uniref:gamma-glutamyl-gamma-aminobutyrate hydrolase n=2 Tax=Roseiterribacter gracilis TaxID=2812848 RepID=A0A8S8XF33_9PROT|nr:gamma-glutamyl-gamma-aminobutyrate hydrolase [Rhodospirillales bacterium TMPK1]